MTSEEFGAAFEASEASEEFGTTATKNSGGIVQALLRIEAQLVRIERLLIVRAPMKLWLMTLRAWQERTDGDEAPHERSKESMPHDRGAADPEGSEGA